MKVGNIKMFLLMLAALLFVACDETEEVSEFDNWRARNEAYIDSIAGVANANADGNWRVYNAYGLVDSLDWDNKYKVYCHVEKAGEGTATPHFNDTVNVNYRGRLIPTAQNAGGMVFDESYSGELDPATDIPVKLNLAGCVRGWTTAVMHMVVGDVWRIYIPYELGYGVTEHSVIPAYSTLIFDMNLVDFHSVGEGRALSDDL